MIAETERTEREQFWCREACFCKKTTSRELQRGWKWWNFHFHTFTFSCYFYVLLNWPSNFVCLWGCIAKKQRTIQVMDIHDLPKSKPKNGFFPKNKGGGGSQTRHWWYMSHCSCHFPRGKTCGGLRIKSPVHPRGISRIINLFFSCGFYFTSNNNNRRKITAIFFVFWKWAYPTSFCRVSEEHVIPGFRIGTKLIGVWKRISLKIYKQCILSWILNWSYWV